MPSPTSFCPAEKAAILDGQALQLRGTSLRLKGDVAQGLEPRCQQADAKLQAVRRRPRRLGNLDARADPRRSRRRSPRTRRIWREADALYRQGVALVEANYPGSAALLNGTVLASPAISPVRGKARPLKPCSARSSTRSRIPATCRPRSLTCFGPMSTFCSPNRGIRGCDRRDFRGDPIDGPPGPFPDAGHPCPRA